MCPLCGMTFYQGHARGCLNGPQQPSNFTSTDTQNSVPLQGQIDSIRRMMRVEPTVETRTFADAWTENYVPSQYSQRIYISGVGDERRFGEKVKKHEITRELSVAGHDLPIHVGCSCGWLLNEEYIRFLNRAELSATIDAHLAGGAVGPTMKKRVRYDVPCFNCDRRPGAEAISHEILSMFCCDGEMQMKPRRRFNLES